MEDGAGMKAEVVRRRIENRDAEHVRGQKVARELNARVVEAERSGQRLRQRGLADARNILDEKVTARQQARKRQLERRVLADDDARELLEHRREARGNG